MLEPVKLSLATFQPNKCYPPYVNTPRSLEACRINGINPIELVEIPFNEFQKDFPTNPEAARRRYERINGARIRIFSQVMKDWKNLVDTKWEPPKDRPKSAKESIVQVSSQAHCTLLELQAQKFRKIEQDNWEALQRSLKLELMRADMEVKHKEIVEKHNQIEQQNNNAAQERQQQREDLYRQQLQRQREEEEQFMRDIKRMQEEYQQNAIEQSRKEAENRRKEKLMREQKEYERVKSEEYTRQMKDAIVSNVENKIENRKKNAEIRAKNEAYRMKQFFDEKQRERDSKKNEVERKLQQAKEEREKQAEEYRQAMLAQIRANEAHRKRVEDMREQQHKQMLEHSGNESFEKMMKIKEKNDNLTKEKVSLYYMLITALEMDLILRYVSLI